MRLDILRYNSDSEAQRLILNKAIDTKHITENERYGIEESWRLEDLENLVKLKSILRMLYYQKKPTECPHNPNTKAKCSGMDRGWCVFDALYPDNTQRCSCNWGFYGDSCQFTMCPGIAQNLYEAD